jgi:hypothetical protein
MSPAASARDPEQPARLAEAPPDPAVLRAERRLRVLQELSEIGMRLARALERRVMAEDEAAQDETAEVGAAEPAAETAARSRDPAVAFAQLSRAIRLTLALEAKTDEALRALMAGIEQARERDRPKRARARLVRIHGLVMDASRGDLRNEDDRERLYDLLDEQLDVEEDFYSDLERPLRDVVERLCQYFRLTPDWSRWDGEGWMEDDPPSWPWAADEARPTDAPPPPALNPAPALAAAHSLE